MDKKTTKTSISNNSPVIHLYPPVIDTATYICNEIKGNVRSIFAKELISLISNHNQTQVIQQQALDKMTPLGKALVMSGPTYNPVANKIADKVSGRIKAYSKWKNLVAKDKIWDHKKMVLQMQNSMEWACDSTTELKFMYDIWSNIHYGFVGRYVGFTEFELINGAGYAQLGDNNRSVGQWLEQYAKNRFVDFGDADILGGFDDAEDTQAIKIGFSLFNKFGCAPELLKPQDIINEIMVFYNNNKPLHVEKFEYH